MLLRIVGAGAALVLTSSFAEGQRARADSTSELSRRALAPIARIVGRWEGDALVRRGPGEPLRIQQTEEITWAASRTALFIRGRGMDPQTRDTVFEAGAVVWYDPDAGKVRMRSHTDGRSVDADVELRTDTLRWGFAVPGGRVQYVIALTADRWIETGDFIPTGQKPIRTTDLQLRRRDP